MTEAEIQFIEDPEIAAAILELKSRWPAVGEAADHPLTEWFVRHHLANRRTDWKNIIYMAARMLTYGCILFFLYTALPRPLHSFISLGALFVPGIEKRLAKRETQRDMLMPLHLIARKGDLSQIEQLWLTPLTYRDCAGVHLGVLYDSMFNRRERFDRNLMIWPLLLLLVFIVNYFVSIFSITAQQTIVLWCCLGVLFLSAYYSFKSKFHLHRELQDIKISMLDPNSMFGHMSKDIGLGGFVSGIAFLLNFGILSIFRSNTWTLINFSILAWSIGIYMWTRILDKRDVDQEFNDFVMAASQDYDDLVFRLMHREENGGQ